MASNKNKNKEKTVESAPVEQVFVPENCEGGSQPQESGSLLASKVLSLKVEVDKIEPGHREIDLAVDELKTLLARVESLAKFIKSAQDSFKKK